jgi:integrase
MSTARYLSPEERERLLAQLTNPRDRLFAVLGLNTGLRVSSLLTLRWGQLIQNGQPASAIEIARRYLKNGRSKNRRRVSTRRIPLNAAATAAIREFAFGKFGSGLPPMGKYVFASRKRFPGVISRKQAHRLIANAAKRAGLEGTVAPHSLRRVFARSCYRASGYDIVATAILMGHASFLSSVAYLRPDPAELAHVYAKLDAPGAEARPPLLLPVALNHHAP